MKYLTYSRLPTYVKLNVSVMTSNALITYYYILLHLNVLCDLLLNNPMAKWNLFVLYNEGYQLM